MKASVLISATDNPYSSKGSQGFLYLVLTSLLCQDTDDFEVLVGNDGGGSSILEVCNNFTASFEGRLRYFDDVGLTAAPDEFRKPAMYTKLAHHAKSSVLITLDHDSLAEKHFVSTCVAAHAKGAVIPTLVIPQSVRSEYTVTWGPPAFVNLTLQTLKDYGKSIGAWYRELSKVPDVFGFSQLCITENFVKQVTPEVIAHTPEQLFEWSHGDLKVAAHDQACYSMMDGEIGNFTISRAKFNEMGGSFRTGTREGRAGAGETYMNKSPVHFAPLAQAVIFHLNHYTSHITTCIESEDWYMDKAQWLRERYENRVDRWRVTEEKILIKKGLKAFHDDDLESVAWKNFQWYMKHFLGVVV
jgi:hypothetical protein